MQHLYEFDGYALDPPQRLVRSQARRPGTAPDRPGVRRIARTGGDGYWINLQAHFDLKMAKDKVGKQAARINPHPHGADGSLQSV